MNQRCQTTTNPFVVLAEAFEEMLHPVAERFKCGWSKLAPNTGKLTIEQSTCHFVQFTTHSYFPRKSLV